MDSVPLAGKTVLVRVDFNVPVKNGKVIDDFRIRSHVPTIQKLLKDRCKVVVISHLGRPGGSPAKALSLEPAAARLARLLKKEVHFVDQVIGPRVRMAIKRAPKNSVIVLQNLRFNLGEEMNDENFARNFAEDTGAAYMVQDAFSVAHRKHASMAALTQFIPTVAGLLMEREVTEIDKALRYPKRPFVVIVGGAKVDDKIALLKNIVKKADSIIVGGAVANTMLAEKGYVVGESVIGAGVDSQIAGLYKDVIDRRGQVDVEEFFVLPTDVAVKDRASERVKRKELHIDRIHDKDQIMDLGASSTADMIRIVEQAGTVVWAGTLGMVEYRSFSYSSSQLAMALASHPNVTSIISGGHTAGFAEQYIRKHQGRYYDHISSGGNASLAFVAGQELPGLKYLLDAPRNLSYTKQEEA